MLLTISSAKNRIKESAYVSIQNIIVINIHRLQSPIHHYRVYTSLGRNRVVEQRVQLTDVLGLGSGGGGSAGGTSDVAVDREKTWDQLWILEISGGKFTQHSVFDLLIWLDTCTKL